MVLNRHGRITSNIKPLKLFPGFTLIFMEFIKIIIIKFMGIFGEVRAPMLLDGDHSCIPEDNNLYPLFVFT